MTGSSLFPAWFSKWILEFAEEQSAVIISPNYRLLPEVKGMDIIQDMKNFWDWFQRGGPERYLRSVGRSEIRLDPEQLLLIGESAGESIMLPFPPTNYTNFLDGGLKGVIWPCNLHCWNLSDPEQ